MKSREQRKGSVRFQPSQEVGEEAGKTNRASSEQIGQRRELTNHGESVYRCGFRSREGHLVGVVEKKWGKWVVV